MAKESDLSDVDPLDFRGALVAFLYEARWIARVWRPGVEGLEHSVASAEVSARRALAAGYTLAELAPESFPVRDFTVGLLESVRQVELAAFSIRAIEANPEEFPDGGVQLRETQAQLADAWRQVRVHYCAMQEFLREVEVRAGVAQMSRGEWKLELLEEPARTTTEVAPRPSGQTPDVQTTDKALSLSEATVGQEWNLVIRAMEAEALADDRVFDVKDVTDEVAYEFLVDLLKGKDEKPSQTFETWRKYVGKFRRIAGNPKRPRRLS